MLVYPHINPVAVGIDIGPFVIGPFTLSHLSVHWYGLMYLAGFIAFILLGRRRIATRLDLGWNKQELDDLLLWGVLGVVIGGRLGQVLFYEPADYFAEPWKIIAIWQGGMSFHGGLIGVLIALWAFGRKTGRVFLQVGDFVAPLVPLGLAFGRIGNFINGELWGRAAPPDLPWAMVFPHVDQVPRHPSQLYQAGLEGLLLFALLWFYSARPRPVGAVSGVFLIGYGVFRFVAEYFREPDTGIFGHSYMVSMGQWLSLPMVLIGIWLLVRSRAR